MKTCENCGRVFNGEVLSNCPGCYVPPVEDAPPVKQQSLMTCVCGRQYRSDILIECPSCGESGIGEEVALQALDSRSSSTQPPLPKPNQGILEVAKNRVSQVSLGIPAKTSKVALLAGGGALLFALVIVAITLSVVAIQGNNSGSSDYAYTDDAGDSGSQESEANSGHFESACTQVWVPNPMGAYNAMVAGQPAGHYQQQCNQVWVPDN